MRKFNDRKNDQESEKENYDIDCRKDRRRVRREREEKKKKHWDNSDDEFENQ